MGGIEVRFSSGHISSKQESRQVGLTAMGSSILLHTTTKGISFHAAETAKVSTDQVIQKEGGEMEGGGRDHIHQTVLLEALLEEASGQGESKLVCAVHHEEHCIVSLRPHEKSIPMAEAPIATTMSSTTLMGNR